MIQLFGDLNGSHIGLSPDRMGMVGSFQIPQPTCAWEMCNHTNHAAGEVGLSHLADPEFLELVETRAWYRWIVGHHIAFGVWRLVADRLASMDRPSHTDSVDQATVAVDILADLYDGYSFSLLYAGSCSKEIYDSAIRPRMFAADPSFSGRWARDYEHMTKLYSRNPNSGNNCLKDAYRRMQQIHVAVAKALVPNGPSLLRSSGHHKDLVTERECDIFDRFFLVERKQICRVAFGLQLADRVSRATKDIQEYPIESISSNSGAAGRILTDSYRILERIEHLATNGQ